MRRALVVGCAECVWEDVKAAKELCDFDAIYCVKLAGVHWPEKFDVWATLHPEFMDNYERQRSALGYPNGYEIVAPPGNEVGSHSNKGNISRRVSYMFKGMSSSASSGIYAAKVAMHDGFDKIILAGIPMDNSKHFSRKQPWNDLSAFISGFTFCAPMLKERVKSMGGFTREVLGAPTQAWLSAAN